MAKIYLNILKECMSMKLDLFASENHCYIICPFCQKEMDYGKINANLSRSQKDVEPCLNCGKLLDLISIDDGLMVLS